MFTSDTAILTMHAITIIFYIAVAIFTLTSALALYSLIRYSKSKVVVVGVSATYIAITVTLFFIALNQLHQIEF